MQSQKLAMRCRGARRGERLYISLKSRIRRRILTEGNAGNSLP
jgi:hypothetical protein